MASAVAPASPRQLCAAAAQGRCPMTDQLDSIRVASPTEGRSPRTLGDLGNPAPRTHAAGESAIFGRVMLPLVRPALATVAVF